jgi:hypothetical protein
MRKAYIVYRFVLGRSVVRFDFASSLHEFRGNLALHRSKDRTLLLFLCECDTAIVSSADFLEQIGGGRGGLMLDVKALRYLSNKYALDRTNMPILSQGKSRTSLMNIHVLVQPAERPKISDTSGYIRSRAEPGLVAATPYLASTAVHHCAGNTQMIDGKCSGHERLLGNSTEAWCAGFLQGPLAFPCLN